MATPRKLQVYGSRISQPTRAVMFLCEMNDLPYDFVVVNVAAPRKRRAEYINNINPNGRIPAIKDTNGVILYEAGAILQYLCARNNWTYLYPTDLKLRAKIDEYMHWHHENTRMITPTYVGPIMRVDIPFTRWLEGTDILQRRKRLKYTLDIIETKRLNKSKYIANNRLSIADILCYEELVQLEVWNLLGDGLNLGFVGDGCKYLKANYPNIHQWTHRMQSIPKHDKVHEIMIKREVIMHVKHRNKGFSKALKQYQSKL